MFDNEFINKRVSNEIEITNKAWEMGLVNVYAYHCFRCNYTWLPKDFDFNWRCGNNKWDDWGQDLLYRQPPKSCARCKSRSWNNSIPRRKLRRNDLIESFVKNGGVEREHIDDRPYFVSKARLRALERQG